MAKMRLLAIDYHRNGCSGQGFWVLMFKDKDGSRKIATWFGHPDEECAAAHPDLQSCYSVLDVDLAAAGSIATHDGERSNAWRGDLYIGQITKWVDEYCALRDHDTRTTWNIGKICKPAPPHPRVFGVADHTGGRKTNDG